MPHMEKREKCYGNRSIQGNLLAFISNYMFNLSVSLACSDICDNNRPILGLNKLPMHISIGTNAALCLVYLEEKYIRRKDLSEFMLRYDEHNGQVS